MAPSLSIPAAANNECQREKNIVGGSKMIDVFIFETKGGTYAYMAKDNPQI